MISDAELAVLEADTYSVVPAGEVYTAGIDRAVITRLADCDVLSIMGTENARQWISDFKAVGVRCATHPQLGACESGFLAGALALWDVVKDHLGTRPLIIQGHSRGAGMVPEIAALAWLAGVKIVRCVLWEAPWCVGPACRDLILGAGIPGVQYIHGDDPVPHIPPVPWLVPNVWEIKHFGEWQLDMFDCHLMAGIVADMAREAGIA